MFEDFKDAPKQELFQTLVLSQILGKILKTEALHACRPPARSRAPPTGYAKKGGGGSPATGACKTRGAMCTAWRVRTSAPVGRAPENGSDAKCRLVVPGLRRGTD